MTEESRGIKDLLSKLQTRRQGGGFVDDRTGAMHTAPWAWRTPDSIYVGWNNSVWMYRALELAPWTWADDADKMRYGSKLSELMADLLGITPRGVLPSSMVDTNREFHLVNITWMEPARPPTENTPELQEYQAAALRHYTVPRRALLMGVRLKPRGQTSNNTVGKNKVAKALQALTLQIMGEDTPDLSAYERDIQEVNAMLRRAGGRLPTRTEQYQLESWYNFGKGPEARMIEEWDHLLIEGFDQIQLAAVSDFHRPILTAPHATWILDAMNHASGPHIISVRGKLMPPQQARSKARQTMRWAEDQAHQEAKTGDVGRREVGDTWQMAEILDGYFAEARYPLLSGTSVVLGRRVDDAAETYVEELRNFYDIEVVPLLGRQLAALDETLPCSEKRVNPYPQELSTDMLAFSGISSFSELGDTEGALVGITAEDGVPVHLDFLGAPKANQPATMAVFGDSGSGKTVLLQNLATQGVLAGLPVVMINPKGMDTLAPFAELVNGRVVSMARVEAEGGYFDPFRFADPEIAADIAATFILSIFTEFSEEQQLYLRDGLRRGAMEHGARCVGEALQHVEDPFVVNLITKAAHSEPRVGLGIGWNPTDRFQLDSNLTLIEFDTTLDLPEPGERPDRMTQRTSLAAMQHVVRCSLEMMAGRTGGVLIVDEAWTFLEQAESRAALEGLGRKGRSMNVLPILATQKVADLLRYDMESLLSRVFCLSMRDPEEAEAALTLAGLEPTDARIGFLADCGPRKGPDGKTRTPLAVHRDLHNRHGVVVLGPIPKRALEAFSTNPEERRRREEAAGRGAATGDAGWQDDETSIEGLDDARTFYEETVEVDDQDRINQAEWQGSERSQPTDSNPTTPQPADSGWRTVPDSRDDQARQTTHKEPGGGWQPARRR